MTPQLQTAAPAVRPATAAAPSYAEAAPSRTRRRWIAILALVVVAVVATLVWRRVATTTTPDDFIVLSGRIEADEAAVAPKLGGRILDIRVREGDSVKAGDVIAVLDDEQVRAREDQAHAALMQSEARANGARDQVAVLQAQLHQAELHTEQAKADAAGRVGQAEADLAGAEAQLTQQQASYQLALFDKDAYTKLAQSGAVSERQAKVAVSTADQQAAGVVAAERRVEAAHGALTMARASLTNPAIREAESATVRKQLALQEAEISSAAAQTEQARAQLAEARANRADLTIRAPFAGTIVTRSAEPGEVVGNGTAIVTLVDLSRVYLRGFVPEGRIGAVKVGQPARVYVDSSPNQAIDASVSRIDPQATFTPENTYFRDDRVKQVVGVKLQLNGAVGFAKPGMPADGEILVVGSVWPKGGRRT
jgi:HlyD family secretion protein